MKKISAIIIVLIMFLLLPAAGAFQQWDVHEAEGDQGIRTGSLNHLWLRQKDPDHWETIVGDNWGRLAWAGDESYAFSCGDFLFNAVIRYDDRPFANIDYSLIYYPDPWPGNGLIVLGEGTSNEYGNVWFSGTFDFESIPIESDTNLGAKIWLVLSNDVDEEIQKMIGWNPTEYLFECNLI